MARLLLFTEEKGGLMNDNIGKVDRYLRIFIGFVLMGVGYFYGSWWGAVGLIPIATAMINWCPLYALFHIDTRESDLATKGR